MQENNKIEQVAVQAPSDGNKTQSLVIVRIRCHISLLPLHFLRKPAGALPYHGKLRILRIPTIGKGIYKKVSSIEET